MTTKCCTTCQLVKSTSEFNKQRKTSNGFRHACRQCQQKEAVDHSERGLNVLKNLAKNKNCCNHCQRPYFDEDWYFFEFDHIDAKLKQSNKETEARWVAGHVNEFATRVAPNLQLLCVKCHKLKSSEESKIGGAVYQKRFGQLKPAEVICHDLTLFDPSLTLEPGEEYSLHTKEGEWITVRDIDGNLIRYEPYSNYIKQ